MPAECFQRNHVVMPQGTSTMDHCSWRSYSFTKFVPLKSELLIVSPSGLRVPESRVMHGREIFAVTPLLRRTVVVGSEKSPGDNASETRLVPGA